ncbi:hypothetical protein LAZ67_14000212 [Cordylochernes scorpioides]|uniref:Mos1 transposase HTH domain-containing protein n=1 Tax=Cordylochernes scorpioides TaxID=51811 RepID=A0ABY6L690_9ARAC|nr:hypothetical protein LAZ67_14000212 [Cordylochernes scorpioides]
MNMRLRLIGRLAARGRVQAPTTTSQKMDPPRTNIHPCTTLMRTNSPKRVPGLLILINQEKNELCPTDANLNATKLLHLKKPFGVHNEEGRRQLQKVPPFVMELPHMSPASCELRSVIRFLAAKKNSAKDIHTELCQVYGEGCMSSGMVRSNPSIFKHCRFDFGNGFV